MAEGADILLIEDDQAFADLLLSFLREGGLSVECNVGGRAGLSRAQAMRPKVIWLSLELEDIDGFELIDHLLRFCPGARLVVSSNSPRVQTWDKTLLCRIGVSAAVSRPVRLPSIEATLREQLAKALESEERAS